MLNLFFQVVCLHVSRCFCLCQPCKDLPVEEKFFKQTGKYLVRSTSIFKAPFETLFSLSSLRISAICLVLPEFTCLSFICIWLKVHPRTSSYGWTSRSEVISRECTKDVGDSGLSIWHSLLSHWRLGI